MEVKRALRHPQKGPGRKARSSNPSSTGQTPGRQKETTTLPTFLSGITCTLRSWAELSGFQMRSIYTFISDQSFIF